MNRSIWWTYGTIVLAMVCWGFNLPLLKYLLTFVGPITMTSARLFVASILVFLMLLPLGVIRMPKRSEWKYIVGGALFNVFLHHYFLNVGLVRTTGVNAGLILGTGPVLTATLTALLLRQFPSRLQWTGVVFGFVGVSSVILLDGGEIVGLSLGDAFIFISILTQVISFLIIAKVAPSFDPRLLTGYMLLVGSVVMLPVGWLQEPREWQTLLAAPSSFWIAFAVSALFGTAVGHMLYNASIGVIGPTKAAIFINLNTVFALGGSALFLGETLTIRHGFALMLIVIGVIFGSGAAEQLLKERKKGTNTY